MSAVEFVTTLSRKRRGPSMWTRHAAHGDRTLCGVELGGPIPGTLPRNEQKLADHPIDCTRDGCKQALAA